MLNGTYILFYSILIQHTKYIVALCTYICSFFKSINCCLLIFNFSGEKTTKSVYLFLIYLFDVFKQE